VAFTFDSLAYAKHLRDYGVPLEQAEAHAEAARTFIMNELVTKEDFRAGLEELRRDLDAKIENLSLRMDGKIENLSLRMDGMSLRLTVRMGIMFAAGLTLLGAVLKLH
jgi:DNA-binding transcriptional MerR regulator